MTIFEKIYGKKVEQKQIEKMPDYGHIFKMYQPPPRPKEVEKIQLMLNQVEIWIERGETEIANKHWTMISEECIQNSIKANEKK
jgi:hypothetical protein